MIRFTFTFLAVAATLIMNTESNADVYELRTYTTNEGKLDALNARFRNHTVALFKKHGMESVGYWVPNQEPESKNTLVYVLKHKSREAAAKSWKAFASDPEWKKVARESQVDGRILAKRPESTYMEVTDYSPGYSEKAKEGSVFELRIYYCNEGKLKNLDARFRDHTIRIFNRFGMKSVMYWHPTDEPQSKDTLIYIIRHDSAEAAEKSWAGFRGDDEWKKVAKESQKDGKFLRDPPVSVYMTSTDYSALK